METWLGMEGPRLGGEVRPAATTELGRVREQGSGQAKKGGRRHGVGLGSWRGGDGMGLEKPGHISDDHRAHREHRDALSPVNPGPKNSSGRRGVRTGQITAPRQAAFHWGHSSRLFHVSRRPVQAAAPLGRKRSSLKCSPVVLMDQATMSKRLMQATIPTYFFFPAFLSRW